MELMWAAASTLAAASGVVVPLQVEVQVKRKGPISSNLCCHLWALHFSEALLWDPQQLLRRARESLEEGGKGQAAVMVTVPAGGKGMCMRWSACWSEPLVQ